VSENLAASGFAVRAVRLVADRRRDLLDAADGLAFSHYGKGRPRGSLELGRGTSPVTGIGRDPGPGGGGYGAPASWRSDCTRLRGSKL